MTIQKLFRGTVIHYEDSRLRVLDSHQQEIILHMHQTECYNKNLERVDEAYFVPGMFVEFETNGIMALSLPPQVTALTIKELSTLTGIILNKEAPLLIRVTDSSSPYYDTLVYIDTDQKDVVLEKDEVIRVIYSGRMTRSFPPRVFADFLEVIEVSS